MQGDRQKCLIQAIVVEVVFFWTEPWVNLYGLMCVDLVSVYNNHIRDVKFILLP